MSCDLKEGVGPNGEKQLVPQPHLATERTKIIGQVSAMTSVMLQSWSEVTGCSYFDSNPSHQMCSCGSRVSTCSAGRPGCSRAVGPRAEERRPARHVGPQHI